MFATVVCALFLYLDSCGSQGYWPNIYLEEWDFSHLDRDLPTGNRVKNFERGILK